MNAWIAIVIGGFVGAPARYLLDRAVTLRVAGATPPREFPWGLFAVNVLGSLLAGLALALTDGSLRILLLAGFCGAFTTFSGFGWEAHRLWEVSRRTFWAAAVAMPVACIAVFIATWQAARALAG
jgi:CrcB protein